MNKISLAIFDMDGLIFNTEEQFSNELSKVMSDYGYRFTKDNYIQTLGLPKSSAKKIMQSIYGKDYPFDEISNIARENLNLIAMRGDLEIKPGISKLLDYFKSNSVPCCVASSSPSYVVKKYLEVAKLIDYFSFVLGGEDVTSPKPAPQIFVKCCQLANTRCENALVFEDSQNGAKAAIAANIPLIVIPDMKSPDKKTLLKSLFVAKDALEALEFIKSYMSL